MQRKHNGTFANGMGVFTLDASNIKGIAHRFACSRPVWIGPQAEQNESGLVADLLLYCNAGI